MTSPAGIDNKGELYVIYNLVNDTFLKRGQSVHENLNNQLIRHSSFMWESGLIHDEDEWNHPLFLIVQRDIDGFTSCKVREKFLSVYEFIIGDCTWNNILIVPLNREGKADFINGFKI